jgi:hypothetical protein
MEPLAGAIREGAGLNVFDSQLEQNAAGEFSFQNDYQSEGLDCSH